MSIICHECTHDKTEYEEEEEKEENGRKRAGENFRMSYFLTKR